MDYRFWMRYKYVIANSAYDYINSFRVGWQPLHSLCFKYNALHLLHRRLLIRPTTITIYNHLNSTSVQLYCLSSGCWANTIHLFSERNILSGLCTYCSTIRLLWIAVLNSSKRNPRAWIVIWAIWIFVERGRPLSMFAEVEVFYACEFPLYWIFESNEVKRKGQQAQKSNNYIELSFGHCPSCTLACTLYTLLLRQIVTGTRQRYYLADIRVDSYHDKNLQGSIESYILLTFELIVVASCWGRASLPEKID